MRKSHNPAEVKLWKELKEKKFHGLHFLRQKPLGQYIADFYCNSMKIIIEVDGGSHIGRAEDDKIRDEYMRAVGITTIRISADMVLNEIGTAITYLETKIFS